MTWLAEALAQCTLTDECEGYLLGRGAKEESIREMGLTTWRTPEGDCPDASFRARYKPYKPQGADLEGYLITPLRSARGALLGIEGRSIREKALTRYLLPNAAWNPVWLGLTPQKMARLWAGGDVWVSEGQFDMLPLEWVIPEKDISLATGRAKLTYQQAEFLQRFCKTPQEQTDGSVFMVYDNDETGKKGMHGWVDETGKERWGAIRTLKRVGLRCQHFPYQGGKDPGEIWDKGGIEGMKAAFPM